jgi:hypothetical protein
VIDRLADLACGHGVGTRICRGCLAELLVLSERGSAAGADFQARRLVAAAAAPAAGGGMKSAEQR